MSNLSTIAAAGTAGVAQRPATSAPDAVAQTKQVQVAAGEAAANGGSEVQADDLHASAAQMQQVVEIASDRRLTLSYDDKAHETVAKITDAKTGEVIEQVPTEGMRKLRGQLREWLGMLFDKHA